MDGSLVLYNHLNKKPKDKEKVVVPMNIETWGFCLLNKRQLALVVKAVSKKLNNDGEVEYFAFVHHYYDMAELKYMMGQMLYHYSHTPNGIPGKYRGVSFEKGAFIVAYDTRRRLFVRCMHTGVFTKDNNGETLHRVHYIDIAPKDMEENLGIYRGYEVVAERHIFPLHPKFAQFTAFGAIMRHLIMRPSGVAEYGTWDDYEPFIGKVCIGIVAGFGHPQGKPEEINLMKMIACDDGEPELEGPIYSEPRSAPWKGPGDVFYGDDYSKV